MRLQVVATLGPFHLLQLDYNAEHVVSVLRATGASTWLLAGLRPGALADPAWPHDADLALELAVVRGARAAGARLVEVRGGPSGALQENRDLRRFVRESGREGGLSAVEAAERRLGELLIQPLGPGEALAGAVKDAAREAHQARLVELGEGPGTAHLERVTAETAQNVVALGLESAALAVSADEWPLLEAALADRGVEAEVPRGLAPEHDPAVRARVTLDRALRLAEDEDLAGLDHALAHLDSPEARFHRATLRIVSEQFDDARVILQALLDQGFDDPPFLPGWTLARLGQLQERAGDRPGAHRSYRATLALGYCPVEATTLAREGLARLERIVSASTGQ